MAIVKNESDTPLHGNRKVNIGVKVNPEVKQQLIEMAESLGITLSEFSEQRLMNYSCLLIEKENALKEIAQLKAALELNKNYGIDLYNQYQLKQLEYKTKIELFNSEKEEFAKKTAYMISQWDIFSDQRLLNFLEQVRGQKDIVITPEGNSFPIVYNTPKDVLIAIIYSYKLKK